MDGILGGGAERLLVRLIHNQISLVITHVRTIMKTVARHGMRHDAEQPFCEFVMIVRELLRQLSGSGIERNTIARGE